MLCEQDPAAFGYVISDVPRKGRGSVLNPIEAPPVCDSGPLPPVDRPHKEMIVGNIPPEFEGYVLNGKYRSTIFRSHIVGMASYFGSLIFSRALMLRA